MYAYKQQIQARPLHAVPQRRVVTAPKPVVRKKIKAKKKRNIFVEFFRLIVTLSFLSAFVYFVFPSAYHSLIKQVFYPTKVSTEVEYRNDMKVVNPAYSTSVDLYTLAQPITKYVHNDLFQNQLMLTPTLQKVHSEVTTMYQTSEMTELKKQLVNLNANYTSIKPAIYVWEYEQGQYVDINANEIYPAASIIKLPYVISV